MRLGARDTGDLLQMQHGAAVHDAGRRQNAVRPRVHGMALRHALAQRAPDLRPLLRAETREPAQPLRERVRRPALERQRITAEQLVEHRVRRQHRQTRCSRLVDDLVRSAGLHVVDEHVYASEELRKLRAWDGIPERDAVALQLAAMALLELAQRRAVKLDLGAVHLLHGTQDRVDPFRR